MAMKVLLVNGSSRKEGCTGAALREVARALQSGGCSRRTGAGGTFGAGIACGI